VKTCRRRPTGTGPVGRPPCADRTTSSALPARRSLPTQQVAATNKAMCTMAPRVDSSDSNGVSAGTYGRGCLSSLSRAHSARALLLVRLRQQSPFLDGCLARPHAVAGRRQCPSIARAHREIFVPRAPCHLSPVRVRCVRAAALTSQSRRLRLRPPPGAPARHGVTAAAKATTTTRAQDKIIRRIVPF
jgi:hypothetical protein